MSQLALYEMRCTDSECKKISLQERSNEHENLCPYCGEFTDYAPGKIEPVLVYTPRSERN
ncbi:TPA: hypothetical protein QCP64_005368 [Bacillus cereus]|nr:hypothetical protein [Bacillus cereus]